MARAIAKLREDAGLTLTQMAELSDCTRQCVQHWERGHSLPTIAKLPEVASALGVTTVELVKIACKLGGVK